MKKLEIILVGVLFLLGIVLIVKGGDSFVDAASWMAEASGIPKLIVGATVVSLATTLPEMLVSVMARRRGEDGYVDRKRSRKRYRQHRTYHGHFSALYACGYKKAGLYREKRTDAGGSGYYSCGGQNRQHKFRSIAGVSNYFAVFLYENVKSAKRKAAIE